MGEKGQIRHYAAFISYRHVSPDRGIARRIHTGIEHFKVPEEYRKSYGNSRLGLAFRDEEELPASGNLSDSIQEALDNSDFLIVVCSPQTPQSLWVEREISYFMEHHPRNHIFAVLVSGSPETSFPAPLLSRTNEQGETEEVEPLAANLTGHGAHLAGGRFHREMNRIYAGILGCPFDALWQREKRYRAKRLATLLGAGLVISLGFLGVVLSQNRQIREQSQQIEADSAAIRQQNREIQERNQQIEEYNEQIMEQIGQIKERENVILTDRGELLLEKGDRRGALKSALEAMDQADGDRPYYAQAEKLLTEALGAYKTGTSFESMQVIEQENRIISFVLNADGSLCYTMDCKGLVSCYELGSGKLRWQRTPRDYSERESLFMDRILDARDTAGNNLKVDELHDAVIVTLPLEVHSLSALTGEERWTIPDTDSYVRTISPDGKQLMVTGWDADGHMEIRLYDLANGHEIDSRTVLPLNEKVDEQYRQSVDYVRKNPAIGAFSDDGKLYAFAVPYEPRPRYDGTASFGGQGLLLYYLWDLESGELHYAGGENVDTLSINAFYGMQITDSRDIIIYRYDIAEHKVMNNLLRAGEITVGRGDGESLLLRSVYEGDEEIDNRVIFLPGKYRTLLSVNNILYMYNAQTGERLWSHNEGKDIEALVWHDPEQTAVGIISQSGHIDQYIVHEDTGLAAMQWHRLLQMDSIVNLQSTPQIFETEGYGEKTLFKDTPKKGAIIGILRHLREKELLFLSVLEDPHIEAVDYDPQPSKEAWREKVEEQADEPDTEDEIGVSFEVSFDRAFTYRTEDGRYEVTLQEIHYDTFLRISDLQTGEVVFEEENYMIPSGLRVWQEPAQERLYIGDGTRLICLDTASFTKILDLKNGVDYLPEEKKIILRVTDDDGEYYYSCPAYTREELVEWGRELLAE